MIVWRLFILIPLSIAVIDGSLRAADWPLWRYDAGHTASSPENLPATLHLRWTRHYTSRTPVWEDPLNQDLMPYDRIFEPVVADGRMFVPFNNSDKVVALDVETGEELWGYYADGPVRLPAAAWQGKVYFASDDGCLYCLEAASGKLKWQFRGGPSARTVLGNGRLISAWPARGGPVLRDGRVYFAASIWPFMGTFLYALDAQTGKPVWVNDRTGSQYILQPHSALSFAGVAPQGTLTATEQLLLVPGGRSVPAALDRQTGEMKYFHLDAGGKGNGGSLVLANESQLFVHTRRRGVRACDLMSGKPTTFTCNEPVLSNEALYTAGNALAKPIVEALGHDKKPKWRLSVDGSGDLIRAGDRLYAAGATAISAIEIPRGGEEARVAWSLPVEGQVLRLLAAEGKLFAVTLDGRIMAFAANPGPAKVLRSTSQSYEPSSEAIEDAKAILQQEGSGEGYALCFGGEDGALIAALASRSNLRIVAVDPDPERIDRLRRRFDAAGLYGSRVALVQGDPGSFQAPPYMANLIVIGRSLAGRVASAPVLRAVYSSLRPYGGSLWLPLAGTDSRALAERAASAGLEGAVAKPAESGLWLVREGPLPGAGSWTHQYGDVANTVKSNDRRVGMPLGLLWFGGNSNVDVLPRHGHGPPEQVVGGRLLIEGMDCLSARDVYTGRVLWKVTIANLDTFGVYFDGSYADAPLSTAVNQVHIPGANARGTNFVATAEAIYVAAGSTCRVLDPRNGATLKVFQLPCKEEERVPPQWAYIGVCQDVLLAGCGFARFNRKLSESTQMQTASPPTRVAEETAPAPAEKLGKRIDQAEGDGKREASAAFVDVSASSGLAALDRHSGKVLWQVQARYGFLHNGIVAGGGRVYCLDRLPASIEQRLARRGDGKPSDYRIVVLDAKTGATCWEAAQDVFGTWLGYSEHHDTLLQAGAAASDRLRDEANRGMMAYRGGDGSVLWKRMDLRYSGPCILHHETIITNADQDSARGGRGAGLPSRALSLLDGSDRMVDNPLTGKAEPWAMPRGKGCNTMTACENLLLFRDGAAGYYDLLGNSGRGNLGGFKSGCTSNLVAADGVLNAPDYTRTCTCAYQNQTSLALVHMPDVEAWTIRDLAQGTAEGGRVKRAGINLGAPGDRGSAEGTLWLGYPRQRSAPPLGFAVTVAGKNLEYFSRHASSIEAGPLPWVASSGARNVESVAIALAVPRKSQPAGQDTPLSPKAAGAQPASGISQQCSPRPAVPQESWQPPLQPMAYRVRLVFSEPDGLARGQRVFSIWFQGQMVADHCDIAKLAGASKRSVVLEFSGIAVRDVLRIDLKPSPVSQALPVLCGVEVVAPNTAE